ncbi:MAG: response regulator [Candidatus Rokubacteria bacterium]|nr:response regulator [Candidatus Rokubacteria bacterium]
MTTMLIVEDDPAWRALYRMELGGQFEVYEAPDGLQALAMLDRVRPDIILLDLKLPRMDGHDFLRALDRRAVRTPVVVCSGMLPEDARSLFPGIRLAQKSADLRYVRGAIRDALGTRWQAPSRPEGGPDWLD